MQTYINIYIQAIQTLLAEEAKSQKKRYDMLNRMAKIPNNHLISKYFIFSHHSPHLPLL